MLNRQELFASLADYESQYKEESLFIPSFTKLLLHPRAFFRDHLPGHITASAWIVDDEMSHVLLTHHAKLNRWLQPGGHADGTENVLEVALKEAEEETGLSNLKLLKPGIFDIDIHTIPARNDFPDHKHYDVRFLFQANRSEGIQISEESHDVKWINFQVLAEVSGNNQSMLRMMEKAQKLFAADKQ